MNLLKGKVAVVTGVNRGIGLAISECFMSQGASVIGVIRSNNDSFKEQFENQDDVKDGAATNTGLTILNKFLNLPVWLRKATGGLAIAGVVILSIALINWLFPVILVGGIAYIFYKFIRDNFMK